MPNPRVVPILWGHDYVANPTTTKYIEQLVSDLVTGPFMNGLAQYGVRRGSVVTPIVIDDKNPPSTITWYDSNNQLIDQITKQLISWIDAGLVPPPPSGSDINQLYLIIPPSETTPETYNGAGDPIGNGTQGWHNEGVTNPGPPPTYYWAIVKTNDCGPASSGFTFVNNFAQKVAHELAEQFSDRNGSFKEIGDPCLNNGDTYRGWQIQQYWSVWDNGCISGDQPPPMPRSFQTVDSYSHIFVLGTDGKLWLEQAPFGNVPPTRVQVDAAAFTFQSLDSQTVLVLGTDGNLWLEHVPFGKVPPTRGQVDSSVQAFQGLDSQTVVVLGTDGKLWLEQAPFGNVPPSRVQVDGNVRAFSEVNENYVFVLGQDGKLWLEQAPFGNVPPTRQLVDENVRAFRALGVYAFVWVLGTDGKLWLEQAPFGKMPPSRQQIDANVMEFVATDAENVLILGIDGKLWWEQAPFGIVPPTRHLVDATVA